MKNMDYFKLLNEKFNITDLHELLEDLIKNSKIEAEKKLATFKRINADYIQLFSLYSSLTDYHLLVLGNYIDVKNKILDYRSNPLYALYIRGEKDNSLVSLLALHLYHFEENTDIEQLMAKLWLELSDIIYFEAAFCLTMNYKESFPNDYRKSQTIDTKFLEQIFIDAQLKKIKELEDDKFNHDDIYAKYVFKLDVVSLRLIFDFMKSYNLLDPSINFGKFAHMLHSSNDWVFDFNLRETEMTFEHLEHLLNLLRFFYKGDKKEYQDFLIKKVKITSKHGNYRYGDEIELKMMKTLYKKFEKSTDDITDYINFLYKKVKSVEMDN